MIQAAKIIGTGLATTGLIGAGVGIGVVFGALILYVDLDLQVILTLLSESEWEFGDVIIVTTEITVTYD